MGSDREAGWLTVPEVAAELRIARSRAYTMVAEGTIPGAVKIGRSIRVNRVQLESWLAKQAYVDVMRR